MFGRGIKIFTLFGIPVYLDVSFFVIVPLFAWLLANNLHSYAQIVGLGEETSQVFGIDTTTAATTADAPADGARVVTPRIARPWLALAFGGLLTIGLYASVLVHEFGHALTARFWNVPTERVTLWFLGGIASLQRMPRQPGAEAIVAIAGPLTSMAVAGLCWALSFAIAPDAYLWQLIIRSLGFVNLMLAIFNLIPALPLDGGRVLRSLLALALPYTKATTVAALVSRIIALLMGLSAFFIFGDLFMVAIAVFIWLAVNAETRQSAIEGLLEGVRVGDVMIRDVRTVPPEMHAGQLLEEMIRTRHVGFPVVDESGRVLGIIGLREFQEGFDPAQPVGSLMRTDFCRISPQASATQAFEDMGRNDFARCVVLDDAGRLQGLLSKSDLMRLMQIRTAALTAASRRVPEAPQQGGTGLDAASRPIFP